MAVEYGHTHYALQNILSYIVVNTPVHDVLKFALILYQDHRVLDIHICHPLLNFSHLQHYTFQKGYAMYG
jgi:hypothetical protein